MDVMAMLEELESEGVIDAVMRNPFAQFGTPENRLVGATLLPERADDTTSLNVYMEENIRYRSPIANAGTRYSPVQLKRGVLIGSFLVKLAESDIGSEFTGQQYDAFLRILNANRSMEATASFVRFLDASVNLPLVHWNERARWQAIENCQVNLRGNNGYTEDVNYSNPSGHRVNAASVWSNDANDPYTDIFAIKTLLAGKGYRISRIITSTAVIAILAGNDKVAARTNRITVTTGGQIQGINSSLSTALLNDINAQNELPPFETYDAMYQTSTGSGRFMTSNSMWFFATTGQDAEIQTQNPDAPRILPNVLGYLGVGRPAGQTGPGRVAISTFFRNKPPRIENEGWQTSLPVVQDPEAIAGIKAIS